MSEINKDKYPFLYKYGRNLTENFRHADDIKAIIGRDKEIRQAIEILAQKEKNNLLLTGLPGVGKTAVIEGIAQRIVTGNIPENLKNSEIVIIDLESITGDNSDGTNFQYKFKQLISEIESLNGQVIPFIDEFHIIMGAGDSSGQMDAANILKPSLAEGNMHLIGATTLNEFHRYLEKDGAIVRRFGRVNIGEPSKKEAVDILRARRRSYEIYHNVTITDEAIEAAVNLSVRYINTGRYLPDKAIDVLDRASSMTKISLSSMPSNLSKMQNKILELEAQAKDIQFKNPLAYEKYNKEITKLKSEFKKGQAKWNLEKKELSQLQKYRKQLEDLRVLKFKTEVSGDKAEKAKLDAIDLPVIENSIAKLKKEFNAKNPSVNSEVTKVSIMKVIEEMTSVPISEMSTDELEKIKGLNQQLKKRVIGQENAISDTAYAIKRSRIGLKNPSSPIGTFLFLGPTGTGKALPNSTMIPTPYGVKELGDLKIGDEVFDRHGNMTTIIGVFPQGEKEVFQLVLEDGRSVLNYDAHLWSVFVNNSNKLETFELKQLIRMMNNGDHIYIPNNGTVNFYKTDFNYDYKKYIEKFTTNQNFEGILPIRALTASLEVRQFLFEHFIKFANKITIDQETFYISDFKNKKLLDQIAFIARSLGKVVYLNNDDNDMSLVIYENIIDSKIEITAINDLNFTDEMTCIYVNNEEHLFLANDFVVTHNTELVKTLAETMFGNEAAMARFDMGGFHDLSSISRLIGASPGQVGYEDGGELTEFVKSNPYSIVLFDEAEKAHPGIWDLMLPIFDDGQIADSRGDVVDFKNTILIMTSNLGAQEIIRDIDMQIIDNPDKKTNVLSQSSINNVMAELRNNNPEKGGRGFKPEFLNRIDSVVMFLPLTDQEYVKIAHLKLESLRKRLIESRNINLVYLEGLKEEGRSDSYPKMDVARFLGSKITHDDKKMGARPINRYVRTYIEDALIDYFLNNNIPNNSFIGIGVSYPAGSRYYQGADGKRRVVSPIIEIYQLTKDEFNEYKEQDPTTKFIKSL